MRDQKTEKSQGSVDHGGQKEALTGDTAIAATITDLMEPLCNAEGVELVHVEYQREAGGRILRMYIDKPGGVTLDDCADISRQAGDILDVHFDYEGSYRLEVSSPGADRPLVKLKDFERFTGERVRIRIASPLNGRKNFTGILLGVSNGDVKLAVDDRTIPIPFTEITKARLVSQ